MVEQYTFSTSDTDNHAPTKVIGVLWESEKKMHQFEPICLTSGHRYHIEHENPVLYVFNDENKTSLSIHAIEGQMKLIFGQDEGGNPQYNFYKVILTDGTLTFESRESNGLLKTIDFKDCEIDVRLFRGDTIAEVLAQTQETVHV